MNKILLIIASVFYFLFASWFLCNQNDHACSSCNSTRYNASFINSAELGSKDQVREFQLVPNVIDFSFDSFESQKGNYYPIFLEYIKSQAMYGQTLIITGYYFDSEKNNSSYDNLGIARAAAIQDVIRAEGVSDVRIELNAQMKSNVSELEELPNPSFDVNWIEKSSNSEEVATINVAEVAIDDQDQLEEDNQTLEVVPEEASVEPYIENQIIPVNIPEELVVEEDVNSNVETFQDKVVLYFPYNSIQIKDYIEVDKYLSKLATHLIDNDAKVLLTGHADNKGTEPSKNRVSLRRAKIIRDILREKGVKRDQIKTESKGSNMPVASNSTNVNRQKNRRVEVHVIE